jgi:hypothetical protein
MTVREIFSPHHNRTVKLGLILSILACLVLALSGDASATCGNARVAGLFFNTVQAPGTPFLTTIVLTPPRGATILASGVSDDRGQQWGPGTPIDMVGTGSPEALTVSVTIDVAGVWVLHAFATDDRDTTYTSPPRVVSVIR